MILPATITAIIAHPGWFQVVVECTETGLYRSEPAEGRVGAEQHARFMEQALRHEVERMKRKEKA